MADLDYEARFIASLTPQERQVCESMNASGRRIEEEVRAAVPFAGEYDRQHDHYVLDENNVCVPCGLGTWAIWFQHERKPGGRHRVGLDKWWTWRVGYVEVSTVFLGLDHSFTMHGRRQLFETMVFITRWRLPIWINRLINRLGLHRSYTLRRWLWLNSNDPYQARYATWAQAERGHRRTVARTKQWLDDAITTDEYQSDELPIDEPMDEPPPKKTWWRRIRLD